MCSTKQSIPDKLGMNSRKNYKPAYAPLRRNLVSACQMVWIVTWNGVVFVLKWYSEPQFCFRCLIICLFFILNHNYPCLVLKWGQHSHKNVNSRKNKSELFWIFHDKNLNFHFFRHFTQIKMVKTPSWVHFHSFKCKKMKTWFWRNFACL